MESKLSLVQRLFNLQKEMGAITKDSENPFYNSSYFNIDQLLRVLKPLLNKHEILLSQPQGHTANGDMLLTTALINPDDRNDALTDSVIIPIAGLDAQKIGGALTYFRRYSLVSMFALEALDDDANSLVKGPAKKPTTKKKNPGAVSW